MAQNINFFGSDQIQTSQYPDVHPSSQEISDEVFQANHSIQNEESLKNSSNEIDASSSNQEKDEPPQESDMLAPILSTKEPKHLLSMGYEHLSITLEVEFDEVTKSNAENLLPIPSECEVTLEDKRECDVPISENSPVCDDHSEIFSDSKIDDDILVYDNDFEDIEREDVADGPEGDIRFLEELLIDDFILSHESSDSNFVDNLSIPQPPSKPPDAETSAGEGIPVVMNDKDKFDEDYHFFIFDKVFCLLFAESEDTIFDPGISA
nr:hypothetical protein [Tanacetum cinerariifolium]